MDKVFSHITYIPTPPIKGLVVKGQKPTLSTPVNCNSFLKMVIDSSLFSGGSRGAR